jgi:hypothetical protein
LASRARTVYAERTRVLRFTRHHICKPQAQRQTPAAALQALCAPCCALEPAVRPQTTHARHLWPAPCVPLRPHRQRKRPEDDLHNRSHQHKQDGHPSNPTRSHRATQIESTRYLWHAPLTHRLCPCVGRAQCDGQNAVRRKSLREPVFMDSSRWRAETLMRGGGAKPSPIERALDSGGGGFAAEGRGPPPLELPASLPILPPPRLPPLLGGLGNAPLPVLAPVLVDPPRGDEKGLAMGLPAPQPPSLID